MKELLIGCGSSRIKKLTRPGRHEWANLVTLDCDPARQPDVLHDLAVLPLPFADDEFDEIHAYDVLEHVGQQGDWRGFFALWSEFWRILQPDGVVFAISPHWSSPWAWGDPGHTRVYGPEILTFLVQPEYERQVVNGMTDYRTCYRADFDVVHSHIEPKPKQFQYGLQAVKPSRYRSA